MSRLGTITRRGLIVGAVSLAGGVAFAAYRVRTPWPNPLLPGLGKGLAALTPYVLIDGTGVTLITPRADMGQGATQIQAALLAEELDVDLSAVRTAPGPPAPAYWNGGIAPEAAAFVHPAPGLVQDAVERAVEAAMKIVGMQITGGSSTVPDAYVKLRAAGAAARETLKAAAARRSGAPAAKLRTGNGAVILPDGTRIAYTELLTDLAGIAVARDVTLRDPSEWRYLGKPMQRVDMVAKCTGTQDYGIDVDLPGMLHATVLLPPAQGGGVAGFDATAAKAMRGVKAVFGVTGGVAVVADNTWRAFRAAEAIRAEWTPSPMPAAMDRHWAALAGAFDANHLDSRKRDDGDVDKAFAHGAPIEAEYRAPYLAHAPLEPLNAVVQVTADGVEVWTGTQIPRFVRANVARIAGVSTDRVTVHAQMIGGSFGHRLEDEVVKHATEIAIRLPGTPVKLTYSRETDMAHDFPREIAMARMRGAVKDGRVEALDLSIAAPSVVASQGARQRYSVPGADSQIVAGAWNAPFRIPNHRVTGYRAEGLAPVSSWRSVGASANGFFWNAALDELIHAAGADPLAERLRLCDDPLARKVLEAVGEMCAWSGPLGGGRGRGIAFVESFGVRTAEVVEVRQTPAGIRVDEVWVAAEVGRVLDPVNFENLVQGGVVWGLGHAMLGEITYTDGIADQTNFDLFQAVRLNQCPKITVKGLENGAEVHGIGEPPVPPAAPALAGAIFAATGRRLREMPFSKSVDFA